LPGPGQQRAEFVGFGPTRFNVYRDIAEIGERLYVIELGRLDQRISEAMTAQLSAPPSEPAKRWFLATSLIGRLARSTYSSRYGVEEHGVAGLLAANQAGRFADRGRLSGRNQHASGASGAVSGLRRCGQQGYGEPGVAEGKR
jgi:hypothetical protein